MSNIKLVRPSDQNCEYLDSEIRVGVFLKFLLYKKGQKISYFIPYS
jgi:hypothetical protein